MTEVTILRLCTVNLMRLSLYVLPQESRCTEDCPRLEGRGNKQ